MSRPRSSRRVLTVVARVAVAAGALALGATGRAAGPADRLLRLVPADVGLTFTVEDLRGHARTMGQSPLVEGLARLPAAEAWRQSKDVRGLGQVVERLKALLGVDFPTMRDGLIGEAVVLTLRLPEGAAPDAARGLLLARVPDRALLDRLIQRGNDAQLARKRLQRVVERRRGEVVYHVREFGGKQPDEFYVVLEGDIFAWTNDERLVTEVIDRRSQGGGLGELPAFRAVRAGLPEGALVSAFVEAGFARRLSAAAVKPGDARGERLAAAVGAYLGAVRYAGAALAWDDGPVVHTHEVLDPARVPEGVRRWASRTEPPDPRLTRVPATTLALVALRGDATSLLDLFRTLTPRADQPRLDAFLVALQGMMLGLDLRDEVAPRLGPGWTLAVEAPEAVAGRVPYVIATQVAATPEGARVATAIDNALRTLLALARLDAKGSTPPPVETQRVSGATVTALAGRGGFAYAVHDGRLFLGTTAAAVVRAIAAQDAPESGARFRTLHERFGRGASNYALIDLEGARRFAEAHRPELIRQMAEGGPPQGAAADPARDLDQAIDLLRLFRAGYLTSTIEPGLGAVHRTLGLVEQPAPAGR